MRRIWTLCWTGFSLPLSLLVMLVSCQSAPDVRGDPICSLRTIEVSEATRAHLRMPLDRNATLPVGYAQFLRDLAAHNAKLRTHCGM